VSEAEGVINAVRAVIDENEAEIDLLAGAVAISRFEDAQADYESISLQLDLMAETVKSRLLPRADVAQHVAMTNLLLFKELGFHGDTSNYYDPRNSCLGLVLERKCGIPITLSIIYVELMRRLGLAADGVPFPSHFLVRVKCESGWIVLDPFMGGQSLSIDDVRERLAATLGPEVAHQADLREVLRAAGKRETLTRMVRNLRLRRWSCATGASPTVSWKPFARRSRISNSTCCRCPMRKTSWMCARP
jgi:regulator of sirC expression with transglutaminase-like and TPR domain